MDWLPQVPVYVYDSSNNIFIVDDRGWDYSASGNAIFAAAGQSGGMGAMEMSGPPPLPSGGGSGYTNSGGGTSLPMPAYSAEDLYLTNFAVSGTTNSMVIHPPASVSNGVYDLLYTTNLSPPISWQWLLTAAAPGPTLLTLTNATNAQRFYQLEGLTNSSAGTDFWVGFMDTEATSLGYPSYTLYISAEESCTGMVSYTLYGGDSGNLTNFLFSLAAGTATNCLVYPYSGSKEYDQVYNDGIHVTASQPVSVYGQCYWPVLCWGFTGWPTPMLGTNYCVLARPSLDSLVGGYSQFAILGTASNTTVNIFPSATANLATNTGSNGLFTVILQPGWTYEIKSRTPTDDVTGTWITSDKPIAIYAGVTLAFVPYDTLATSGPGNPLVQEQLPVSSWGNQALSLSFGRPGGDSYRILSLTNTTVVITTNNGAVTNELTNGQTLDVLLDGPVEFQANNPIQVAQISQGAVTDTNAFGEPLGEPFGDPCEILLPPTGHYLTSYTFTVPDYTDTQDHPFENFVTLIVPQSALSTTLLDGTNISANNFQPIGHSGYSAARISVSPLTYTVSSSQPMEVEVYGFGEADAYGFIGGATVFP